MITVWRSFLIRDRLNKPKARYDVSVQYNEQNLIKLDRYDIIA